MTCHYPDLGSASDWLKRAGTSFQPIRSTTKVWVVTCHQYGISALVTQTSFCEGSSGDLAKRRLFSQARLSAKLRSFLPKMFATGDDKCLVAIFKEFLWRRPPRLLTKYPSSYVWYKRQPMVVNKINEMMMPIIKDTSLEDLSKAFSNHNLRKTVFKKLRTAGLQRSSIPKVTGHRNLQSLDVYDEVGGGDEQRQL